MPCRGVFFAITVEEAEGLLAADGDHEMYRQVSAALQPLTEEWFKERDRTIVARGDSPADERDREYTWDWFQPVRELYAKAAANGRAVIFTVDQ